MELYFYDIEVSPNALMITFIPNCQDKIIKAYINADIEDNDIDKGVILEQGIKPITFIIGNFGKEGIINDYPLLFDFVSIHRVYIGYNNNNYDNLILDYIIYNYNKFNDKLKYVQSIKDFNSIIYEISQKIVAYGKGYNRIFYNEYHIFKYMKPYTAYDIQKILYLDKSFTSLKQVAIQLKWYRIQDLPYHYDESWTKNMIPMIKDYNINDCLITRELFNNQIDEVKLRNDVSEEYEINLHNQSRSGMANILAAKFYGEKSGLERKQFIDLRTDNIVYIKFRDIISSKITFKTEKLNNLLLELKGYNHRVGSDTFNKEILFNNTLYTFATGGLHSNDNPKVLKSTKDIILKDADVSSFYPRLMINLEVFPQHLNKKAFLDLIIDLTEQRLNNKEIVKELKTKIKSIGLNNEEEILFNKANTATEALKIVINAIYGKLGDRDSFLYDLKAMYTVTINGQLMLLMLCEELELNGFHVVSTNTDGIIAEVDLYREYIYNEICNNWSKKLDFTLEFTNYEKIVRTNVNNYIAIKEGFSNVYNSLLEKYNSYFNIPNKDLKTIEKLYIKEKGSDFLDEPIFNKGYYAPIIAKALKARYVYGVNTNEYFDFNKDIYDYCISQKISNDFYMTIRSSENGKVTNEEIQKNNRYYVSNGSKSLIKVYKHPKKNKKGVTIREINVLSHCSIKLFNVFHKPPYDINYRYYKKEVMNTIVDIEETTQTLF